MAIAETALILDDEGGLVVEALPATTLEEAVEPDASSEDATDDEEEEEEGEEEGVEEEEEEEEEGEEDVLCLAAADAPLTTPVLHGQLACLFHSQSFRIHV